MCGGTRGGQGDGGEGQRVGRAAAASRSRSVRNSWKSSSPPLPPRHPPQSGTLAVTLDGHTMTIQGKPTVTLEGQKVICEEHQLAPRGTKVTRTSTAHTSS